jgi:RNA polymerase-interacting CarD/CdnL/TRCF family regulator
MSPHLFQPGDRVFHPTYGLGVIEALTTRGEAGQETEYYAVRLADAAILSVPIDRAEALGLRRIVNGLTAILTCLHSQAQSLPQDGRQRAVELKARSSSPQPDALTQAVRDLVGCSRPQDLTPADKKWLDSACERLSAEAALVDAIGLNEARRAIRLEVSRLRSSA